MSDVRLIERWLPIGALSEESVRERRSMTALPPIYYLHVWWARRPLVASRAAILASLLPESSNHLDFQKAIGILGDPVKTRRRIDLAKKTGEDLGIDPYGYKRAFTYAPSISELNALGLDTSKSHLVLDPTAGGGSIPFEAVRLGVGALANDLNPVAAVILNATVDYPSKYGSALAEDFKVVSGEVGKRLSSALKDLYPREGGARVDGYLFARTVMCPYCSGIIPLSPNWQLSSDGLGVRVVPNVCTGLGSASRVCSFEIVKGAAHHSAGTVSDGDATCPFPDCARVVDGDEVKRQAQAGAMGEQLFTVVLKRQVDVRLKSGKLGKPKWVRDYRAPRPEDDNSADIAAQLAGKLPEWELLDILPNEVVPIGNKTDEALRYGVKTWRDMFSPRQLLAHGYACEILREMVEGDRDAGRLSDLRRATYVYLSFSLDKLRDYNSRMTRWHSKREVIVNTFDRHDFAFKWSYAEMPVMIEGLGFQWVID